MIHKKYKLFLEDKKTSIEDLENFNKGLINQFKEFSKITDTFDIKDIEEVKKYIIKDIITLELRKKVKDLYNIEIPPINYLRKGFSSKEYHRIFRYDLVDSIFPNKQNFNLEIEIEVPKGKEFIEDNSVVQISLWISGKGKKGRSKKDFFEMLNRKISTDSEFNRYTVLGIIQSFGKLINEKI